MQRCAVQIRRCSISLRTTPMSELHSWLRNGITKSVCELYRPNDHLLSAKLVSTFADRGCHVVSVTDSYGRILDFLDRNRYFFFQVATQLYSRG
jgi:hypothetical protein